MESDPEAGNGSDPPPQAPAASSSVSGDTAAATAGASRPAAVRRGTDSGSGMVERDERSTFSKSKDYSSFRSSISQRQVLVRHQQREYRWRLYDHGPKSVRTPLLLLPPVSGTADVWYQQMLPLACQGFRCIALDYPLVDSVPELMEVLSKLLEEMEIEHVHICGASLGAFIAQKFAEFTWKARRVRSLFLINGFTDTSVFRSVAPVLALKMMPTFMLKRIVLQSFPTHVMERDIADSVDFMVERLDSLPRDELLARLILNVRPEYVEPEKISLQEMPITVVNVNDHSALTTTVKAEIEKYYPDAKLATLKDGGNFPYISRATEINVFLRIHLMKFAGTRFSATGDQTLNGMIQAANDAATESVA